VLSAPTGDRRVERHRSDCLPKEPRHGPSLVAAATPAPPPNPTVYATPALSTPRFPTTTSSGISTLPAVLTTLPERYRSRNGCRTHAPECQRGHAFHGQLPAAGSRDASSARHPLAELRPVEVRTKSGSGHRAR
jgi:hypothetical protein